MRAPSGWRRSSASLAVALLAAACPRTQDPAPAPTPVVPAGVVRVAVPEEPPTLDPLTRAGLAPATRMLLPLLTPVVADRPPAPGVAAATLTRVADEVTIRVAPGPVWSDGSAVDAEDVARTWRLVRGARLPFDGYERIRDARLNDDGTVTLDDPTGASDDGLRVLPPGFRGSAYARAWPVSGGPFLLASWRRGQRLSFTDNPTAPGRVPRLSALHLEVVADPDAAIALFRRGRIDVVTRYGAPAWHARLERAGAVLSDPGEGRAVALVLRAPRSATLRSGMLARIDLQRLNSVLVQDEALFGCDAEPARAPCSANPTVPGTGDEVSGLRFAFAPSDALAGRLAVALRRMMGPSRLQPRDDVWTHLGEVDVFLETANGTAIDDLRAAGAGSGARVFVLFVAKGALGARVRLDAPGGDGPFSGAGDWPPSAGEA